MIFIAKKRFRLSGGGALCLVLSGLLWGCSRERPAPRPAAPARPEAVSSEPSRRLRWMGHWKGEGRRERLVRDVLENFAYTHPDIEVEFEFAADVLPRKSQGQAALHIAEMIRSGKLDWDVIWLDPLIYHQVAEELDDENWGRKHLVDFSEIAGFTERHKPFVVEGGRASRHTGGVFTGPLIEGFFYAVWYNPATAERLGLKVREVGMTERDLLGYVERVHEYNQTAERPVAPFIDDASSGSLARLFYSLFFSANSDEEGGEGVADAARVVLNLFEKMKNIEPALTLSVEDWREAGRALLDGEALFYFDATWRYTAFERLDPRGVGGSRIAQFPEFEGHRHVVGGYIPVWAVLKNAPGREAAIELMEYWCQPEVAEQWVRETKCPTGLEGGLYDPGFGGDEHAEFQREIERGSRHWIPDPLMFPFSAAEDGADPLGEAVSRALELARESEPPL